MPEELSFDDTILDSGRVNEHVWKITIDDHQRHDGVKSGLLVWQEKISKHFQTIFYAKLFVLMIVRFIKLDFESWLPKIIQIQILFLALNWFKSFREEN